MAKKRLQYAVTLAYDPSMEKKPEKPEFDTNFNIRIQKDWLLNLDDIRRHEKDVPSRAEMIRRLVIRAAGKINGGLDTGENRISKTEVGG